MGGMSWAYSEPDANGHSYTMFIVAFGAYHTDAVIAEDEKYVASFLKDFRATPTGTYTLNDVARYLILGIAKKRRNVNRHRYPYFQAMFQGSKFPQTFLMKWQQHPTFNSGDLTAMHEDLKRYFTENYYTENSLARVYDEVIGKIIARALKSQRARSSSDSSRGRRR